MDAMNNDNLIENLIAECRVAAEDDAMLSMSGYQLPPLNRRISLPPLPLRVSHRVNGDQIDFRGEEAPPQNMERKMMAER